MRLLLLTLCLAPQAQNAEAKKLLDALAPPLKDPSYSQIEWQAGVVKWVGHFNRQKAWRLDRTAEEREVSYLFDGKDFLDYKKYSISFRRTKGESPLFLLDK